MKTIRVRIAVAVDHYGDWSACGWRGATDQTRQDTALDGLKGDGRVVWVEADVPIPEDLTVEGRVAE